MVLKKHEEFHALEIPMELEYSWGAGPHLQKFFQGLKEGKILVNKCPSCGRHQIPPINVCGRCHVEMGEWEEVGPRGTIFAYQVVAEPVYDAGLAGMREVPYATAHIILDGAPDATFFWMVDELDPEKAKIGTRVEVVFKPEQERQGLMTDIAHFRIIEE